MKIFQSTPSALLLLLTTVALAPTANAASALALAYPSVMPPSAQLISQTPPVLLQGDSGTAVADLQNNLTTLGYFSDTITGYFGSMTEDAVRNFQRDVGQLVDGVVGPSTLEVILQRVGSASSVPVSGTIRYNDSGAQVSELQRRLTDLGYFSVPITGYFGPETQGAVINFQRANGIAVDGIVGEGTAEALRQAQ